MTEVKPEPCCKWAIGKDVQLCECGEALSIAKGVPFCRNPGCKVNLSIRAAVKEMKR